MTKVFQIMTVAPQVVTPDETIDQVARVLADFDIGGVIVRSSDHRIQGMITDRDITTQVVARGLDPTYTTARDLLDSSEVITVDVNANIKDAAEIMSTHAVRRLPVLDGPDLVGIVSQADLAIHAPVKSVGALVEHISEAPDNTGRG